MDVWVSVPPQPGRWSNSAHRSMSFGVLMFYCREGREQTGNGVGIASTQRTWYVPYETTSRTCMFPGPLARHGGASGYVGGM